MFLRWTGIAAATTAATACLLLLITYGLLRSESGRAWMVQILNWHLSTPGESEIRIGHLEGDLLDTIEVHDLQIDDGDGTWLRLEFAGAAWRPELLLAGRLGISNLDIDGLAVLRRPRRVESDEDFSWPELPLAVTIERFSLNEVILEHPVLGEEVIFRASGDTEIRGADRVGTTIEIARTDGVSGQAQLEATLQPRSKYLRFQLSFDEDGGGVLARTLNLDGLPSLSIQASGEGQLDELSGTATAAAGDLAFVASNFTIATGDRPTLNLVGHARIEKLIDEPLRRLLASGVEFDLRADLNDNGVVLQSGLLANDLIRIEVSGELANFAADFDVALAVDDLGPPSELLGTTLRGRLGAQTRIQSNDIRRGVSAAIHATLSDVLAEANPLLEVVGSEVEIGSELEFDSERQWQFHNLTVTGNAMDLTADGSLGGNSDKLDIDYQLTLPRLAALSEFVGTPLAGNLTITGDMGGSLADPTLTVQLQSPALSIDEIVLGAAEARVDIPQFAETIIGDVELSIANEHFGAVNLASKFATGEDDRLRLDGLTVESGDTLLTGAVAIDLSNTTVTGEMTGEKIDLASWSDLAGRALSGSASVTLDLNGSGRAQRLDLAVAADGLNVEVDPQESLHVDSVRATARVVDLFGTPSGGMRLLATDAKYSDARFTSMAFEARMDTPQLLQGKLQARGELRGPFELEMSADYAPRDRGFVLTVAEVDASLSGQTIKLSKPLRLEHDNGTTSLSKSMLSVAGGSLTASGEVGIDRIGGRLEVDGISIAALQTTVPTMDLSGTLSGHAQVSGSRAAPTGELDLRIVDVRSADSKLSGAAPVSGRLRGDWRGGRLRLSADFGGVAEASVEASASASLRLEPDTLALTMPANEAIDGTLNWSGQLAPIWDLFSPYEDRFTGQGEIALALAGSLGNPQVSGYFQVTGGRYENLQSATTLADVDLRVEGNGDELILERLTAGDGYSGSLQGKGSIDLVPEKSYPIDLRLEFSDMRLVALDDVRLDASGTLAIGGTLSDMALSGDIVTGQSGLNLAGTVPPSVVELDVEEVNVSSAKHANHSTPARTADSSTMVLDLKISVPGRAFVRGLGLDSEWGGDIEVSGPVGAPILVGALNPVRGQFLLMGTNFRLGHGTIRFTGTDDIDPLLDLTAEHKAASLTALVRITGSASKPRILLTSRPPLPESEIASQILFGTNSSNLTAAQSLQLASAIATYSGRAGAFGILDATRRALGVDVINFSESEKNPDKTRVSVGKYVSEGVYIEVEGGGEESSRASTTIEVEVLPNVRLEGGTTETGGNEVGVKWKWDY